jgi:hypothetical protein
MIIERFDFCTLPRDEAKSGHLFFNPHRFSPSAVDDLRGFFAFQVIKRMAKSCWGTFALARMTPFCVGGFV